MSKLDKAINRLKAAPKDYTYSEAKQLLGQLGFEESTKGKTSGSRVKFSWGRYESGDGSRPAFYIEEKRRCVR